MEPKHKRFKQTKLTFSGITLTYSVFLLFYSPVRCFHHVARYDFMTIRHLNVVI